MYTEVSKVFLDEVEGLAWKSSGYPNDDDDKGILVIEKDTERVLVGPVTYNYHQTITNDYNEIRETLFTKNALKHYNGFEEYGADILSIRGVCSDIDIELDIIPILRIWGLINDKEGLVIHPISNHIKKNDTDAFIPIVLAANYHKDLNAYEVAHSIGEQYDIPVSDLSNGLYISHSNREFSETLERLFEISNNSEEINVPVAYSNNQTRKT